MADATATQLVQRVLEKLHVLVDGEVATAGDTALVTAAIVAVNEKLRDKGVCHWTDTAFPQSVKEDLAMYVACHCAADFMGSEAGGAFDQRHRGMAEAELRSLTATSRGRVDMPPRQPAF